MGVVVMAVVMHGTILYCEGQDVQASVAVAYDEGKNQVWARGGGRRGVREGAGGGSAGGGGFPVAKSRRGKLG